MTDAQARTVDVVCKIIATIGFVLGGLWTYGTYLQSSRSQAKAPFLERRLETYIETLKAVSDMATAPNEQVKTTARAKFWELYHGPMPLVETVEVNTPMDAIADCLRSHECDKEAPLRALAPPLIKACKESIEKEWHVTLSPKIDLFKGGEE